MLSAVEFIIKLFSRIFVFSVKTGALILNWAAALIQFILMAIVLSATMHAIEIMPPFWQSLTLKLLIFGGALSFISIVTLLIWKPKKFFKIFKER